ncbi:GNAT family N-acetyltransferase [Streptomyces sp. LP05-1]|uniref:GNAT family N-acetyltransferase n=1 Tax=Streptomyces pyxinae TaxID=2970734 RepID=A0ABT2CPH3_9ACTN|nr:GNAT family protein [Streptomyces sp. LP05-1]MCS0639156.1 GNAT family N-acetyltransferase [Streptomyces sp. LP05-1]
MTIIIRAGEPGDAVALAGAFRRNREHLRPYEPERGAEFYTPEGQAERLREAGAPQWFAVEETCGGTGGGMGGETDGRPGGEPGRIVAGARLSGIVRGPFRSASLGYWTDAEYTGRGLATALVTEVCRAARETLGLHRIQAGTLLDNLASQRVLARCGFERIGLAPRYLHIAGEWRDHYLHQRILHDDPPPAGY